MAYKFQLGEARLSGSLIQEGGVTAEGSALSGSSMTLPAGGLSLAGAAITATAAELNYLDNDDLASSDFVKLAALTVSAAELNVLDGLAQGNILIGDGDGAAATLGAGGDGKILIGNGTTLTSVAVSGDVTINNAGAVTIAADAVEGSMLNDNVISGQTELAHADIADADELMISDGGTLKKVGVDSLQNHYFAAISGDATVADGGALTIAANAVEGSMLNTNVINSTSFQIASDEIQLKTSVAGDGLALASHALAVNTSGAIHVASDKVSISGSIAGNGLSYAGGVDSISGLALQLNTVDGNAGSSFTVSSNGLALKSSVAGTGLALASGIINVDIDGLDALGGTGIAQGDHLMFSDDGTEKKITFSNLEDAIFGNVSGDATIAAGGALTIANDAVEQAMIADDAVGADQLASNAVVNASVASGAAIAANKLDFNVDLGGNVTFGNQSDDTVSFTGPVTVGGDLTVNGSVTSINSTTINITSSFTFEGPADDHETTLAAGTPTADITVMLPQYNTAETVHMAVLADATTAASADVTAAEFALLDGGSSIGTTTIASGDGFLHNDGGTMKQTQIDKLTEKFAGNGLSAAGVEMNLDINGLAGTLTAVAQTDKLAVVDSGDSNISKNITFSNLEDQIFGNVSSQATIAAGGALSLAAAAITGQTEMTGDVADADEFMISDGGVLKRVDFSVVRDAAFADISGDATVAAGGALTIAADAIESGMLNDNIISGQTELASGGVVDADEMMISDDGTIKRVGVDSLAVYMRKQSVAAFGDANATLAIGVNYASANPTADRTLTLPASPVIGQSVKVKCAGNMTGGNIIISRAGSQLIDGEQTITLESPFAAIEMIYVANNIWRVF